MTTETMFCRNESFIFYKSKCRCNSYMCHKSDLCIKLLSTQRKKYTNIKMKYIEMKPML